MSLHRYCSVTVTEEKTLVIIAFIYPKLMKRYYRLDNSKQGSPDWTTVDTKTAPAETQHQTEHRSRHQIWRRRLTL